jgi:hypothetical protein
MHKTNLRNGSCTIRRGRRRTMYEYQFILEDGTIISIAASSRAEAAKKLRGEA